MGVVLYFLSFVLSLVLFPFFLSAVSSFFFFFLLSFSSSTVVTADNIYYMTWPLC